MQDIRNFLNIKLVEKREKEKKESINDMNNKIISDMNNNPYSDNENITFDDVNKNKNSCSSKKHSSKNSTVTSRKNSTSTKNKMHFNNFDSENDDAIKSAIGQKTFDLDIGSEELNELIEDIYKKKCTKESTESFARYLRMSNLKLHEIPFYDLRKNDLKVGYTPRCISICYMNY